MTLENLFLKGTRPPSDLTREEFLQKEKISEKLLSEKQALKTKPVVHLKNELKPSKTIKDSKPKATNDDERGARNSRDDEKVGRMSLVYRKLRRNQSAYKEKKKMIRPSETMKKTNLGTRSCLCWSSKMKWMKWRSR